MRVLAQARARLNQFDRYDLDLCDYDSRVRYHAQRCRGGRSGVYVWTLISKSELQNKLKRQIENTHVLDIETLRRFIYEQGGVEYYVDNNAGGAELGIRQNILGS